MKRTLLATLLLSLLCVGTAFAFEYPQVAGTWVGGVYGHGDILMDDKSEVVFHDGKNLDSTCYQITDQQGRFFWGRKTITNPQGKVIVDETFSGVFERDSRDFQILEHIDGQSTGTVFGENEIEIIHMEVSKQGNRPLLLIYELSRK